jgi:hypothetical protein
MKIAALGQVFSKKIAGCMVPDSGSTLSCVGITSRLSSERVAGAAKHSARITFFVHSVSLYGGASTRAGTPGKNPNTVSLSGMPGRV